MNAYLISSKKFDLDCEKAVAEFESANSQFLISYYEHCDDFDYMSVYTEDAEDLREALPLVLLGGELEELRFRRFWMPCRILQPI